MFLPKSLIIGQFTLVNKYNNNKLYFFGIHIWTVRQKEYWGLKLFGKITGKTGKIIGYFENLDLAAMARWEAEKEYGYPNCYSESSAFKYLVERGIL